MAHALPSPHQMTADMTTAKLNVNVVVLDDAKWMATDFFVVDI
jgi:hypothetical protein